MIKYISLFSGIGAPEKALKKLNIPYELLGFSEIDKFAIKSYCKVHNVDESLNLGDITKIDINTLPTDIDLITHGSPCQDFSVAGKGLGGDKGSNTRSSLMWNTVDIVKHCKPKYILWENVKNLLSKKHRHNFDAYIETMSNLGYNNYYEVLNAKDYGVPQNRERVFTVSIRKDIDNKSFKFPQKQVLTIKLKDILEDNVDKKYYLDQEKLDKIFHWKAHQRPLERVLGKKSIVPTLTARGAGEYHSGIVLLNEYFNKTTNIDKIITADFRYDEGLRIRKGEIVPCLTCRTGNSSLSGNPYVISKNEINVTGNYSPSGHSASRTVDMNGITPTVMENHGTVTAMNTFKIRKLTPKECWRLMGFEDEDFNKAAEINSNTQLYKQAGNSIVVNVLVEIFKQLFN